MCFTTRSLLTINSINKLVEEIKFIYKLVKYLKIDSLWR